MVNIEKNNDFYLIKADISCSEIEYLLKNKYGKNNNLSVDGEEYDYEVGINNPVTYISFNGEDSKNLTKNLKLRKEISTLLRKQGRTEL